MEDVFVVHNKALSSGGGIYNQGQLWAAGLNVWFNVTTTPGFRHSGGGIYNQDDAYLELYFADISNNGTFEEGGGIYNGGELYMAGGWIEDNHANELGGGIYSETAAMTSVTLLGVNIKGNDAKYGGGVFVAEGTIKLEECDIRDNTATELGSAGCRGALGNWNLINCTGNGTWEVLIP